MAAPLDYLDKYFEDTIKKFFENLPENKNLDHTALRIYAQLFYRDPSVEPLEKFLINYFINILEYKNKKLIIIGTLPNGTPADSVVHVKDKTDTSAVKPLFKDAFTRYEYHNKDALISLIYYELFGKNVIIDTSTLSKEGLKVQTDMMAIIQDKLVELSGKTDLETQTYIGRFVKVMKEFAKYVKNNNIVFSTITSENISSIEKFVDYLYPGYTNLVSVDGVSFEEKAGTTVDKLKETLSEMDFSGTPGRKNFFQEIDKDPVQAKEFMNRVAEIEGRRKTKKDKLKSIVADVAGLALMIPDKQSRDYLMTQMADGALQENHSMMIIKQKLTPEEKKKLEEEKALQLAEEEQQRKVAEARRDVELYNIQKTAAEAQKAFEGSVPIDMGKKLEEARKDLVSRAITLYEQYKKIPDPTSEEPENQIIFEKAKLEFENNMIDFKNSYNRYVAEFNKENFEKLKNSANDNLGMIDASYNLDRILTLTIPKAKTGGDPIQSIDRVIGDIVLKYMDRYGSSPRGPGVPPPQQGPQPEPGMPPQEQQLGPGMPPPQGPQPGPGMPPQGPRAQPQGPGAPPQGPQQGPEVAPQEPQEQQAPEQESPEQQPQGNCKHDEISEAQIKDITNCEKKRKSTILLKIHPDHNNTDECRTKATEKTKTFNNTCSNYVDQNRPPMQPGQPGQPGQQGQPEQQEQPGQPEQKAPQPYGLPAAAPAEPRVEAAQEGAPQPAATVPHVGMLGAPTPAEYAKPEAEAAPQGAPQQANKFEEHGNHVAMLDDNPIMRPPVAEPVQQLNKQPYFAQSEIDMGDGEVDLCLGDEPEKSQIIRDGCYKTRLHEWLNEYVRQSDPNFYDKPANGNENNGHTVIDKYSKLIDRFKIQDGTDNEENIYILNVILAYIRAKYYDEVPRILAHIKSDTLYNYLSEKYINKQCLKFAIDDDTGAGKLYVDEWWVVISNYRNAILKEWKPLYENLKEHIIKKQLSKKSQQIFLVSIINQQNTLIGKLGKAIRKINTKPPLGLLKDLENAIGNAANAINNSDTTKQYKQILENKKIIDESLEYIKQKPTEYPSKNVSLIEQLQNRIEIINDINKQQGGGDEDDEKEEQERDMDEDTRRMQEYKMAVEGLEKARATIVDAETVIVGFKALLDKYTVESPLVSLEKTNKEYNDLKVELAKFAKDKSDLYSKLVKQEGAFNRYYMTYASLLRAENKIKERLQEGKDIAIKVLTKDIKLSVSQQPESIDKIIRFIEETYGADPEKTNTIIPATNFDAVRTAVSEKIKAQKDIEIDNILHGLASMNMTGVTSGNQDKVKGPITIIFQESYERSRGDVFKLYSDSLKELLVKMPSYTDVEEQEKNKKYELEVKKAESGSVEGTLESTVDPTEVESQTGLLAEQKQKLHEAIEHIKAMVDKIHVEKFKNGWVKDLKDLREGSASIESLLQKLIDRTTKAMEGVKKRLQSISGVSDSPSSSPSSGYQDMMPREREREGYMGIGGSPKEDTNDPQVAYKVLTEKVTKLKELVDQLISFSQRNSNSVALIATNGEPSMFVQLYNKYIEDRADPKISKLEASEGLTKGVTANVLAPRQVLQVDIYDKTVFVGLTFLMRLFAVSLTNFLIDKKLLKTIEKVLAVYLAIYTAFFALIVILINIDSYRMRIVFNYINVHGGYGPVLMHTLIVWIIGSLMFIVLKNIKIINNPTNSKITEARTSEERARLRNRIGLISMLIMAFTTFAVAFS